MSREKKEVYANAKQLKFLRSRAKRKTFNGGRGSGKTRTLGIDVYNSFWELPKGKMILVGETYVQLDAVVIPGITAALESIGFKEYNPKTCPEGVYVTGIAPPKHWETPWEQVGKRAMPYTRHFINGFCIQFVSQDNAQTHRGINSDCVRVDESAQIKEEFLGEVVLPTMRANKWRKIANSPKWKSFYDFSSAAWTESGQWIYKTEELYNKMLVERAKMSETEKERIPPSHLFLESTWVDNKDVLPDDYASSLRDLLTDLQYQVEVENMRITKLPNCYYYAFNTEVHCYTPS
ncbi:MAG: terminase large subunit domain-containing protein, partial [Runella zeae]